MNYQLVLVLKSSLKEEGRKKLLESIKSLVKEAKFTKEEDWGEKTLSYPIKRQSTGFFVNYLFEIKESLTNDLEKRLLAQEDILRHLILRK